ncbi:MAG: cation diffusion facilitator family transporter [Oscillospiraceae bacterium]
MTNWLLRHFAKMPQEASPTQKHTAVGKLAGRVGIVCNLLLVLAKLVAGFLSGSLSVAADAVNNLSDAAASVITLLGFRLADKPADKEHPFGHARSEYIAGLIVAVLVLLIGFEIGRSGVERILAPASVSFTWPVLAVLVASIFVKLWMASFNRTLGKKIDSAALEATFADSRNDALATLAVLAGAAVEYFTGWQIDGWMSLAVAAFIIISGIGILRDTLSPLLGQAPSEEMVQSIRKKIESYDGVLGTHDLIVHDYGAGRCFASAHVEMSSQRDVLEAHDTIDNIEQDFLKNDNIHLIIHYDPVVTGDAAADSARQLITERVQQIDSRLSIHDLRIVDGPTHTNYVFDVVVPTGFSVKDSDLKEMIEQKLQHGTKPVYAVITIDHSYAPIP